MDNYVLSANYPNPFNPNTNINYQLALVIYNLLGQKVATLVNERQQAGFHQARWDASGFACGIYYYQLKAGEFTDMKKMILIK